MVVRMFLAVCLGQAINCSAKIEVFTIINRDANEIKLSIQDFLAKNAVIKVDQNKLIIDSSPENIITLKELIANLDLAKRQLKLAVYFGEDPTANAEVVTIASNTQGNNNLHTVYVEDGEMVSVSENSLVKIIKSQSGGLQQLQSAQARNLQTSTPTFDPTLSGQLQTANTNLQTQQGAMLTAQQNLQRYKSNPADTALPTNSTLDTLNQNLTAANSSLATAQQNLRMLQAQQDNLTANSSSTENTQTNLNAASGAESADYLNLPAGIYLKPKVINDNSLRVEINIVKEDAAINDNFAGASKNISKQIKTTMQTTINKWQQVAGENNNKENTEKITTYATGRAAAANKKVWLKIEFVDPN